MAQNKIVYSLVGGSDNSQSAPNIEGTALSVNCFTEANTDGPENKDVRTFLQSCPGVKFYDSLGTKMSCDGMYVPSTGLAIMDYQQCLFVAYNGEIWKIDSAKNKEVVGEYAIGNTVQFAESGGERAILMWVDGTDIHGYNLKTGQRVEITLPKRIDAENQYIQPTHIAVVDGSIVLNDKGSSFTYYSIKFPLNTEKRKVFDILNGKVQYDTDGITVLEKEVDSGIYCFLDDYGVQKYFNGSTSSDKCIALSSVGPLLTLFGPSSIEFWQKGDILVITIYAVILAAFCLAYGAGKIGYLRSFEIFLSQAISILVTNVIAYAQLSLMNAGLAKIKYILAITAAQLVFALIWAYVSNFIYRIVFAPRNLLLVSGDRPVDAIVKKFNSRKDRFAISNQLPGAQVPVLTWDIIKGLVSPAITIAILGAIESLLSATVADGVIGDRHDSNTELIAQGMANLASPLFGGIPATGAIARTMTNINNGGRSPMAGHHPCRCAAAYLPVPHALGAIYPHGLSGWCAGYCEL